MKTIRVSLFAVLALAFLMSASEDVARKNMTKYMNDMSKKFPTYVFDSETTDIGYTYQGYALVIQTTLYSENKYIFLAAGDESVADVSIEVYDYGGKTRWCCNTESGGAKGVFVQFEPNYTGEYLIKIKLNKASTEGSWVGYAFGYAPLEEEGKTKQKGKK
ncbi:MAG: hypothetical protein AABZ39_03855 [Spirochaetota bacterium]